MNTSRLNNFRMAAYGALAIGLINLRYQTGENQNVIKSLALILPGALLLAISFIEFGKKWLATRAAAQVVTATWVLLAIYSFLV